MKRLFEKKVDCQIYTSRVKVGNIKSKSMRQPVNFVVAIVKALLIILKSFYNLIHLLFLFKMITENSRKFIEDSLVNQIFPT